jgi:hypothetical protein
LFKKFTPSVRKAAVTEVREQYLGVGQRVVPEAKPVPATQQPGKNP